MRSYGLLIIDCQGKHDELMTQLSNKNGIWQFDSNFIIKITFYRDFNPFYLYSIDFLLNIILSWRSTIYMPEQSSTCLNSKTHRGSNEIIVPGWNFSYRLNLPKIPRGIYNMSVNYYDIYASILRQWICFLGLENY